MSLPRVNTSIRSSLMRYKQRMIAKLLLLNRSPKNLLIRQYRAFNLLLMLLGQKHLLLRLKNLEPRLRLLIQ
ncbi:hypothetical protein BOP93_06940 [Pseudomonas orientalis]|uniref:Uncharacterized protein n=1 Tax=Pseudomonas orientalis TaxID=76758 RepID=A0A2L0RTQ6_9PSED|nr:hypothetical protein BOP93_06940 [Pseudomonas orientalis]